MFEELSGIRHIKLKTWKNKNAGLSIEKWPICAIFGEPISKKQADEIIRRTDGFFQGYDGNDYKFNKAAGKIVGMPNIANFVPYDFEGTQEEWRKKWDEYDAANKAFKEYWGIIDLYHLHNEWISTCNGAGASGWCSPEGIIQYSQNVGKWPTIEDIMHDLTAIAEAFPFLHLWCTLVNHNYDYSYTSPKDVMEFKEVPESVITFEVKDGQVGILTTALPTAYVLEYAGYTGELQLPSKKIKKLSRKAGHSTWYHGEGIYSLRRIKKWKRAHDKQFKLKRDRS